MFEIIINLFNDHSALILFFGAILAQLGIPVGIMFFIMFAGALTTNFVDLLPTFLIVLAGEVIGDLSAYHIGKNLSHLSAIQKIFQKPHINYLMQKSGNFLKKHGDSSVFITRFVVFGLGPYLNYLVGLQRYSIKKFILAVIAGEILYATELLLLGYIFKDTFEDIVIIISNFSTLIILGLILYFLSKKSFRKH